MLDAGLVTYVVCSGLMRARRGVVGLLSQALSWVMLLMARKTALATVQPALVVCG